MKRKSESVIYKELSKMPHAYHTLPGQKFKAEDSEVFDYIKNNNAIIQEIFNIYKSALVYDTASKTWSGKEYYED